MKVASLKDRMKGNYEERAQTYLLRRMPVIIRLDGRSFHTLTRNCTKPFDEGLSYCLESTALLLCREIQGAKCAYLQSDEISLLLTDFDTLATMAWFDYSVQKVASVTAGLASASFSTLWGGLGVFDSRVFNMPKEEVANYFVWRQKDWIRNSVMMLAQSHFSHKQLHKKSQADIHEMLHGIGVNWAQLPDKWKNGLFIEMSEGRWATRAAPIFTSDRGAVENYIKGEE